MKTVNLVVGIVLLIIALGSWGGAAVIASGNCATNQLSSDINGIPLCSTATSEIVVLGFLGLVFLIISIVLLVRGRRVVPAQVAAPPAVAPLQVCLKCGTQRTSAAPFCPSCGTPYPVGMPIPSPPPPT
jgi:hypothetical protein